MVAKVSWGKPPEKTILEMSFTVSLARGFNLRYWFASQLIRLAAWIIKSRVVTRKTLPVLELE